MKEELKRKTCKELRDIAKELNISGRWNMNKKELIDAIEACDFNDDEIEFENDCVIKQNNKIKSEGNQKDKKRTIEYVNNIKTGTLIAFKLNKNKNVAMSAKFVEFNDEGNIIAVSKICNKIIRECII